MLSPTAVYLAFDTIFEKVRPKINFDSSFNFIEIKHKIY